MKGYDNYDCKWYIHSCMQRTVYASLHVPACDGDRAGVFSKFARTTESTAEGVLATMPPVWGAPQRAHAKSKFARLPSCQGPALESGSESGEGPRLHVQGLAREQANGVRIRIVAGFEGLFFRVQGHLESSPQHTSAQHLLPLPMPESKWLSWPGGRPLAAIGATLPAPGAEIPEKPSNLSSLSRDRCRQRPACVPPIPANKHNAKRRNGAHCRRRARPLTAAGSRSAREPGRCASDPGEPAPTPPPPHVPSLRLVRPASPRPSPAVPPRWPLTPPPLPPPLPLTPPLPPYALGPKRAALAAPLGCARRPANPLAPTVAPLAQA